MAEGNDGEARLNATLSSILGVAGVKAESHVAKPKPHATPGQRARNKFLVLNAQAMMRQPPRLPKHPVPVDAAELPNPGTVPAWRLLCGASGHTCGWCWCWPAENDTVAA